jgi:hypothetical protein
MGEADSLVSEFTNPHPWLTIEHGLNSGETLMYPGVPNPTSQLKQSSPDDLVRVVQLR